MGVEKIEVLEDLILGEEVMNQIEALGITEDIEALDDRVDNLEEAVQIIQAGGEILMGSYICGDWTDWNDNETVMFGDWTA